MIKSIEAVVFDLDGVITDTAKFHYLAWKGLANELGFDIDEQLNERLKGVSRMESLAIVLEAGGLQNRFSDEEKIDLATKKNEHYNELLKDLTPGDILPGILNIIDQIRAENIPIGLASVSRNASTVLKGLELEHFFDYCADPATIERAKPDPAIFLDVCHAFNVNPNLAIGIEDAQAGIEAINAANMFAVGIGGALQGADLLLTTTEQLNWTQLKQAFSRANT